MAMDGAFSKAHDAKGVPLTRQEIAEEIEDNLDEIVGFCVQMQNMLPRQKHPLLRDAITRTHHILANVHTSLLGQIPEVAEGRASLSSIADIVDQPFARFKASYTTFSTNLKSAAGYRPQDLVKVQNSYNTAYGHFQALFSCAGKTLPASLAAAVSRGVVSLDPNDSVS